MKIAWFHGNMLHTHSGGTRYVIDYSIGLKKTFNHEVTVFCDRASGEVKSWLNDADIPLVEIDRTSTYNPVYWLTLPWRNRSKRKKLAYLDREFDCIINSLLPMNVLVSTFNVPKVQMCYEPFAFFYDSGFLKNFTLPQQWFFRLMKVFYERADKDAVAGMEKILTVNKTNLPKIEAIYGRTAIPVYAGIDTNVYKRADQHEIDRLREEHRGSPLLFHSSDLTGIKGTYPLLETVKQLLPDFPELKLLVTVYLDLPDGIERLKKRIRDMGLDSNVVFLGCLPKEQLPLYYSAVDFVCQPSLNQPANWPLKEAMLCGTPIIGGKESEEVDGRNGVKIDVSNTEEALSLLRNLFVTDRSAFIIDVDGLKSQYSIEGCLSQFNETVLSACK
jgi:glycosyltransferase involved in cell wall biosynthesis